VLGLRVLALAAVLFFVVGLITGTGIGQAAVLLVVVVLVVTVTGVVDLAIRRR
jgi:hypothetical protein